MGVHPPIISDIHDWPIARLFQDKQAFVERVVAEARGELIRHAGTSNKSVSDLLAEAMYLEQIRMKEDPWKVDPPDESTFWRQIKHQLVEAEQHEAHTTPQQLHHQMLEEVVSRYAQEIASTFKPGSYHFAKRVLPFLFSTLLNASAGKTIKAVIYHNLHLQQRVHLLGKTQAIRKLAQKGTIVLVPTHISNLDSILVGWGLHALGLPAFIYGAGLNLYNNMLLAYFMQRLGAYKVDRRKRNPIYRQTLDTYSTVAIERGVHSLFFPGGTRSRSGEIEKKLKLGLLGTAMEAQRRLFINNQTGRGNKIFVVPMVMSYHFVLEAASLINQHLRRTGKEQYYIINDEFASYTKFFKFVWKTFRSSSDIALAFGKPMDMFGNFVDEEGVSYDQRGTPIDIREYFMNKGEITRDEQRDREYTRLLGEQIVDRYHVENRVYSSHLVAFAAFEMFRQRNASLDLYGLLRLPEEDRKLDRQAYLQTLERLLGQLNRLADSGKVHLADHLSTDPVSVLEHGVKNLGLYHPKRPLVINKKGELISDNLNLLYYYHNRLEGYELERYV